MRHMFTFCVKKEFERLNSKKVELEILLEQDDSYARSLEGDMDTLREEASSLRSELMRRYGRLMSKMVLS